MQRLGVNLHLELKNATTHSQKMLPLISKKCYHSFPNNATTHSQKTRSSQIYSFKSAGDQMVSTPIQPECAVCILVIP